MGKIEIVGHEYESFVFPGGEVHVRIKAPTPHFHYKVNAYLENTEDVLKLLLLSDAIKRSSGKIHWLTIPYVPYARQDRVCNPGESLSIKVMADLINLIAAERVFIHDPHSDVTPALIENVQVIAQHALIPPEILEGKILICPDAGAEKKILKLGKPYVMATKIRDTKTGEILRTEVYSNPLTMPGSDCLIVDDICDGGRTFIEIAKVLKDHGAASVELYTTHGIFSKGFSVFEGFIDAIHYYKYGELQCWSSDKK